METRRKRHLSSIESSSKSKRPRRRTEVSLPENKERSNQEMDINIKKLKKEDEVITIELDENETFDYSSKKARNSSNLKDHVSKADKCSLKDHKEVPLDVQGSLEREEKPNQLLCNKHPFLNASEIPTEENAEKDVVEPLPPEIPSSVKNIRTSNEQSESLIQPSTREQTEQETPLVTQSSRTTAKQMLDTRDEESLVAAQSMTSLANGHCSNGAHIPVEEQSPSSIAEVDRSPRKRGNNNEEEIPNIRYRMDPTYQDLSGESNANPTEKQGIDESSIPSMQPGNEWNAQGVPLHSSNLNNRWNYHSHSYSCNQNNILPPASSLLKVPRIYDENMNIQHGPNSYQTARSGPMPGFANNMGQAIQTVSTPTRMENHYEGPHMSVPDSHFPYHSQMMNNPEYYVMPSNHGSAIGPGNSAHIFNSFPHSDHQFPPAANIEIPESGQYHESGSANYHRRTRSSKAKPNQNYLDIVKNFVYSPKEEYIMTRPRDEYIVAPHDVFGKPPDDKDTFYMAISPEVNPTEVQSIDHKGLISKYIDYLLIENEHITEMSKSVSIPIENCVMDDPYLMDIVRVKIPFPTPKYLQWLSSYYPTIQVDWPAIKKELAAYNGDGGRKPKRTYFLDRRPSHILLGESFYFFQREKDKQSTEK
ncbi:uncharacterized protein LOC133206350 [Saccostrea echinata]|uniref:uncharacterized protein LOC133206350 n=1 Tax=Saccostrea echinata TaxID=191078 RepID=UPI002A7FEFA6|nr:uncharacterized protein LOC133206350 [Saccostrea echinata]